MNKLNIKEILEDYQPSDDIFNDEDELVNKLKHIIYKLNEVDKRIILMYAELKSLRKLGLELGISVSSAWIKVNEIRDKIYKELEKYD